MFLGSAKEHKRSICESRPFFHSSPLSPLFWAPLPAPHALATPAPRSPRAQPAMPRPTLTWSRLASARRRLPGPAPQRAPAVGPTCLARAPPGCTHRPCLAPPPFTDAWPSEPLRRLVPIPNQPRLAARAGPTCLGRAPPGQACWPRLTPPNSVPWPPSPAPPASAPPRPVMHAGRWPRPTQQRALAA
jgi:hypothetical protein